MDEVSVESLALSMQSHLLSEVQHSTSSTGLTDSQQASDHGDKPSSLNNSFSLHLDQETLSNIMNSEEQTIEFDIPSVNHPRLNTPFYHELRKKYPRAFRRKASLSSLFSDNESICSEAASSKPTNMKSPTQKVGQGQGQGQDGGGGSNTGLPPRPPKPAESNGDLTITGCSRRPNKNGLRGILKNGSQYSSAASLHSEALSLPPSDSSTLKRSDSMLSLKERLQQNKQSWSKLQSPFEKKSSKLKHNSHEKPVDNNNITKVNHNLSASAPNIGLANPRRGSENLTVQHKPPLSVNTGSKQQQQQPHMRRFASPDSSHDSAVDMDTASLQSSPSSDNHTTSNHASRQRTRSNMPTKDRPPRSRTPKLKSSRAKQQALSPKGQSSQPVVNGYDNAGAKDVDGGGTSCYTKVGDSDGDSGIAAAHWASPLRLDIPSTSEDEQIHRTLPPHPQTDKRKTHTDAQTHGRAPAQPVRGDHTIASPINSPREQQGEEPPLPSYQYPRLCSSTENLNSPSHHQRAGTPDSNGRRREKVTFEDEIHGSHKPLAHGNRAVSQPSLHTDLTLPPGDSTIDLNTHSGNKANGILDASDRSLCRFQSDGGINEIWHSTATGDDLNVSLDSPDILAISLSQDTLDSSINVHRVSPVKTQVANHKLRSTEQPTPTKSKPKPAAKPPIPHKGKTTNPKSPVRTNVKSEPAYQDVGEIPPPLSTSGSEWDLSSEVAFYTGVLDGTELEQGSRKKEKKSILPWKKNKGRYTPSKELEKLETKVLSESGRSLSRCSLNSETALVATLQSDTPARKPPIAVKPQTKQSSTPSNHGNRPGSAGDKQRMNHEMPSEETPYETVEYRCESKPSGKKVKGQGQPARTSQVKENSPKDDEPYATVDISKKPPKGKPSQNKPAACNLCVSIDSQDIVEEDGPALPHRGYNGGSNLEKSKELSGSKSSLSGRMGGLRDSAKKKWGQLRRAVSLERVDKDEEEVPKQEMTRKDSGKMKKSPSLQSLTNLFKGRRGSKGSEMEEQVGDVTDKTEAKHRKPPCPPQSSFRASKRGLKLKDINTETPQHFRPIGRLKSVNSDGTQIIEMSRPKEGPMGFYVAQGNEKFKHGVFVSRLSDALPEHFFAGLLSVGDEVLEVNGRKVASLPLEGVYDLMSRGDRVLLKILPYMARTDT